MRVYENEMKITKESIKNNYENSIFKRKDVVVCEKCGAVTKYGSNGLCDNCKGKRV